MKVELNDVIEAIEYANEMLNHYYNKKTGVIIYKEDSDTSYSAEDIHRINELEEWEIELVKSLNDLKENPEDYIKLPNKEEVDELKMMIDFCNSFSDISLEKSLSGSSDEKTKLHEIKKIIQDKGLMNDWYDYRESSEREIAIEWCNDNNIKYIEL